MTDNGKLDQMNWIDWQCWIINQISIGWSRRERHAIVCKVDHCGIALHENGICGYVKQSMVSRENHRSARWKQSKLLLAGHWKSCHENVGRWPFFSLESLPFFSAPTVPLTVTATWRWTKTIFFFFLRSINGTSSWGRVRLFFFFFRGIFFSNGNYPVVSICIYLSKTDWRMVW